MKTLAEQLNAAFRSKGWTLDRLLAESGVEFSRWSMQRKLSGRQKLTTDECETLANALGVTIAWAPNAPAPTKRKAS